MFSPYIDERIGRIWGLLGGSIGAAGWIFGAAIELDNGGRDAGDVFLCAAAVVLVGCLLGVYSSAVRRLSLFVVIETLLASSVLFGTLALWRLHSRGVLAFALDQNGRYPEALAWICPALLCASLVLLWYRPIRNTMSAKSTSIPATSDGVN